jgi:uncharacterized protein (TIGR00730 family)
MKRVCVFCGSNAGARPEYAATARELGTLLAQRGIGLVYGGAHVGLMGIVADAALAAGGEVIGVIPDSLVRKEIAHRSLSDLQIVGSMHERKARLAELGDGFLALPGGCGTFEEFFEIVTWAQLGMHSKPIGLLNVAGFYDALLSLLEHSIAEKFIRAEHRGLVLDDDDPARLLDRMTAYVPTIRPKWIDKDEI